MELPLLCLLAFVAGFIDAIIGGGAFIQLPALFILMPEFPGATVVATNKLSSLSGQAAAAVGYLRRVHLDRRLVAVAALSATTFALLGATLLIRIPESLLRPMFLVVLIAMFIFTLYNKNFGVKTSTKPAPQTLMKLAVVVGALFGFYDGVFAAGSGSMVIFLLIWLLGFDFLHASAAAKWINIAANISALIYLAYHNHIYYTYALPMALCNMIGATLGAKLAIRRGNLFIRRLFLTAVVVILIKFAWDILP